MNEDGPGFRTEKLVAEAMMNQGWNLAHAPSVDTRASHQAVAPMIDGNDHSQIMPDILAMRFGRTVWVEVKYKSSGPIAVGKNGGRLEHFIDRTNWDDYNDVEKRGSCEVWVVILEGDTNTLQRQDIREIDVVGHWTESKVEEKNGSCYGNPGVFIPQSDFIPMGLPQSLAPENFFGQNRLPVDGVGGEILPKQEEEEEEEEPEDPQQSGLADFAADGGQFDESREFEPAEGVECPACELVTVIMYRCQHCGHDLAGDKATEGRQ